LDLAIVGETTLDDIGALRDTLCESDLPYRVDIVELAHTDETFRQIIESDRIAIQSGSTQT
jgi:hypothetical protein